MHSASFAFKYQNLSAPVISYISSAQAFIKGGFKWHLSFFKWGVCVHQCYKLHM